MITKLRLTSVCLCFLISTQALGSNDIIEGFAKWQAGRIERIAIDEAMNDIAKNRYIQKYFPNTSRNIMFYDNVSAKRLIPLLQGFIEMDVNNFKKIETCIRDHNKNLKEAIASEKTKNIEAGGKNIGALINSIDQLVSLKNKDNQFNSYSAEDFINGNCKKYHFVKIDPMEQEVSSQNIPLNDKILATLALNADFKFSSSSIDREKYNIPDFKVIKHFIESADLLERRIKSLKATHIYKLESRIDDLKSLYINDLENRVNELKEKYRDDLNNKIKELKEKYNSNIEDRINKLKAKYRTDLESRVKELKLKHSDYLEHQINELKLEHSINENSTHIDKVHNMLIMLDLFGVNDEDFNGFNRLKSIVLFMASLVDAKNSGADAVSSLLSAYVDEQDTYNRKRENSGYFSFVKKRTMIDGGSEVTKDNYYIWCTGKLFFPCRNTLFFSSYYGLSVGDLASGPNGENELNARAFGPVGLEFKLISIKGSPISLNYSPIDIGNYVTAELKGDSYDAQIEDIIAPSMFFSWSSARKPFSILVGKQKDIKLENGMTDEGYFISIAFDLPIFTIY